MLSFQDETRSSKLPLLLFDTELKFKSLQEEKNKKETEDIDSRENVVLFIIEDTLVYIQNQSNYIKRKSLQLITEFSKVE